MAKVSVRRLGKVEAGMLEESPVSEDFVDPAPVVLWHEGTPAAVLTYRDQGNAVTRSGTQSFARIEEGLSEKLRGLASPFPVSYRYTLTSDEQKKETLDLFDLQEVHNADVNGDGVDELVLFRQLGGVAVHGLDKTLFKHDGWASQVASYGPRGVHRARAGGRDVLYAVLSRKVHDESQSSRPAEVGAADPSIVLRIDGGGVARLSLGAAVRDAQVLAVGAVNLPGSQAIDELLVLSSRGDDVFLSRHRPEGSPLDAPRKVYVPFPVAPPIQFAFVPQSKRAVVFQGTRVCFIEADKPVNWIRSVDLEPVAELARLELLGAVDGSSDPKAILLRGDVVYAVNQEGTLFGWSGGGFVPVKEPEPFLRVVPPSPQHNLVGVFAADGGGEELLVVHTRRRQLRDPSFEETLRAAERFLDPAEFTWEKRALEPALDEDSPLRDSLMDEEMRSKGVQQKPATVEEWKRILPESYARMVEDRKLSFTVHALSAMERVHDPKARPDRFRHPDELKTWLAGIELPAETTFDLYRRGQRVTSSRAPGFLDLAARLRLGRRIVAFRARGASAAVVLALEPAGEQPTERAGFFLVHLGEER